MDTACFVLSFILLMSMLDSWSDIFVNAELSPNPDADQSNSRTHNHKEATLSGGQLTQSWSHPVTQSGLMYPQPHQIQPHHNHPLLTPSNTATSGNAFGGAWDNETSVAALRQSFSTPGPQQLTPPGAFSNRRD